MHSDGSLLFPRDGGLLFPRERDHCNQKVAYYFPENEAIAFRWWLIISQRTGTFQTYGVLQSDGSLLFPRERDHCNQKVAYYFPENETMAIRRWLIISQSTGIITTWCFAVRRWLIVSKRTRPLHSNGNLLFLRVRELSKHMVLCNQMVPYYFSEYGNYSNIWCFAIRW